MKLFMADFLYLYSKEAERNMWNYVTTYVSLRHLLKGSELK